MPKAKRRHVDYARVTAGSRCHRACGGAYKRAFRPARTKRPLPERQSVLIEAPNGPQPRRRGAGRIVVDVTNEWNRLEGVGRPRAITHEPRGGAAASA
jgi:hypothetical protein